ncbi:beta-galactosidase [Leuconostoc gelidum]|jgi:beta-galactosidase|uniref:beta-galactosidase n=1 Tax=Leuconostoc gelidum TaxID=1244 RepID=UPI002F3535B4
MPNSLQISKFLHGGDYNPEQWIDNPDIIDRDFTLFEQSKINTFTLGIFAWTKLEPKEGVYDFEWLDNIFDRIEQQNGNIILATPSGARPRWMSQKYPEILRTNEQGKKLLFGERHNHCLSSPVYREKTQEINRQLAKRYGHRKSLILWHISNELGGECHCELCQEAFRKWMKNKYKTIDNLNKLYWSSFWSHQYNSWEEIHSPSILGDTTSLSLNLDWKRFVTDQTIDFFENEIKPLREITPDIPVTTNFMGGNPPDSSVYQGLDYQKFSGHVDVISWDSYPNWSNDYESAEDLAMKTALMNDVMRGLKHDSYLIMESTPSQVNWHPFNKSKRPGMHEMGSLQQIAHGANSVLYFQLHQSRGSSEMFHGAVVTHGLSNQTRTFRDVSEVGRDLERLQSLIKTKYIQPKIAIVFDYDNMWALEDARNYSDQTKSYWSTIQNHYSVFWHNNVPVDIISTKDDLSPYTLIIDPMHFMMDKEFMNKIEKYVSLGGNIVGTYMTGIVNKNYLAYLGGWPQKLQKIYGLSYIETDTLYPKQTNTVKWEGQKFTILNYADIFDLKEARPLAHYEDDFYAKSPALTENNFGSGTAMMIAGRTENTFLNKFYNKLLDKFSLRDSESPLENTDANLNVQVRQDENKTYYFITNYSDSEQIAVFKDNYTNILSGNSLNGPTTFAPYQVVVATED